MHRLGLLFLGATVLLGCGDDSGGTDGGPGDAGGDAGPGVDGGQDAAMTDGGGPDAGPPPVELATDVCPSISGNQSIDLADDGTRVAVATSCGFGGRVLVIDLDPFATIDVGPAAVANFVQLSPSARYVVFGSGPSFSIREAAAGAGPAVPFSTHPTPNRHRFAVVDGEERLIILASPPGTQELIVRTSADDFATSTQLTENPGLEDISLLVTPSGRNLIYELDSPAYERVPTDATAAPVGIAVSPTEYFFAPIGLGDTHGVGVSSDGELAFFAFDTRDIVVLAPDGVSRSSDQLEAMDGGARYIYFMRNGDPTRRIRDGSLPLEPLADANATDIALTPDGARLLFVSDGMVSSVPAAGGAAVVLFAATVDALTLAFAPDSSTVAVWLEGGGLRRAPVDRAGAAEDLETSGVRATSLHYDGGGRLLYIRDGELRVAAPGAAPVTVAVDVEDLHVAADTVVYRTEDGTLYRLP